MLLRMRSLLRDVAEFQLGSGKVTASPRTTERKPGKQRQQQQRQKQPSATSTAPAGTADAAAMVGRAGAAAAAAGATATNPTNTTRCLRPRRKNALLAEASPLCLCLVAGRPPGELSRSVAKVSRAREVLDALGEGRAHAGRWFRWASSALVAAESAAPPRSGGGAAAAGSRGKLFLLEDDW